jgi:hypothetical protein
LRRLCDAYLLPPHFITFGLSNDWPTPCPMAMTSSSVAIAPNGAYLPLTTVFTPPPSCFTAISQYSPYGYPNSYSVNLAPGDEGCTACWLGLPTSTNCFPSAWDVSAVYSASVCPQGYHLACSSINRINTTASETVGTCCPRLEHPPKNWRNADLLFVASIFAKQRIYLQYHLHGSRPSHAHLPMAMEISVLTFFTCGTGGALS